MGRGSVNTTQRYTEVSPVEAARHTAALTRRRHGGTAGVAASWVDEQTARPHRRGAERAGAVLPGLAHRRARAPRRKPRRTRHPIPQANARTASSAPSPRRAAAPSR